MPAAQAQAGLLLLLAVHLAAAVYWDAKERRIPNRIVFSGLLAATLQFLLQRYKTFKNNEMDYFCELV